MEFIQIKELSQNDGDDILEMIREIGPGENGFGNVDYDMEDSEFGNYIKKNINMSKGIDLEPNWVPASKYWLIIDGFPTGISQLFVFRDNEIGNAFWSTTGWTKREDIFVYSKNI